MVNILNQRKDFLATYRDNLDEGQKKKLISQIKKMQKKIEHEERLMFK